MSEYIGVVGFMRANALDPSAGLSGPMTSSHTSSLRDFIAKRTPRFDPTIKGSFGEDDVQHMLLGIGGENDVKDKFDLHDYSAVRKRAQEIYASVSTEDELKRMPPPPEGKRWSEDLLQPFRRWMAGGMPP